MEGCIFQLKYDASSTQISILADILLRLICLVFPGTPGTSGTISDNYILLYSVPGFPGTECLDVSRLFSESDYGCVCQQGILWLNQNSCSPRRVQTEILLLGSSISAETLPEHPIVTMEVFSEELTNFSRNSH